MTQAGTVHPQDATRFILHETDSIGTVEPVTEQQQEEPQVSFAGRIYRRLHPVQFCAMCGAASGCVTTAASVVVAYFSFQNASYIPFGVSLLTGYLGLSMLCTGGTSTGYLCAWRPLKQLEKITETIEEVANDIGDKKVSFDIGLESLEQQVKELKTQNTKLQNLYNQATTTVSEKTTLIEKLTLKIESIKQGLLQAETLASKWQSSAQTISAQIKQFKPSDMAVQIQTLTSETSHLQEVESNLQLDVSELHTFLKTLQGARTSWDQMLTQIHEAFTLLTNDVQQKNSSLETAHAEISRLQESNEELNHASLKLDATIAEMKTLLTRYEAAAKLLSNSETV